jgi:very-short-patch-repair endonuclease
MKFLDWAKNKFKKKEEYHEIFLEEPKAEEGIDIKAKREIHKELQNIGIFPKIKYYVGHIQVDFAFPKEKVAIEIIGEQSGEESSFLKKKYSTLTAFGWVVYGFPAEKVYMNAKEVSAKVKKIVSYHKKE